MAVAEKTCLEDAMQEMQIFKELDKGIEDMEAGRVIEHDEAMRILKERINRDFASVKEFAGLETDIKDEYRIPF